MTAIFEAKYRGTCPRCGGPIDPGQLVHYVDDELVHHAHASAPERPVVICQECWLARPCGCDDDQ